MMTPFPSIATLVDWYVTSRLLRVSLSVCAIGQGYPWFSPNSSSLAASAGPSAYAGQSARPCTRYRARRWAFSLTSKLTQLLTTDMVFHMKTTLNIDDSVMQRLREEAARRGTTMSALAEEGLRRVLDECSLSPSDNKPLPPLPTRRSGGLLVDVSNREELYRVLEEERDALYRR